MQTEEMKEKDKVKKYEAKEIKAEIKQERVKYQRERKIQKQNTVHEKTTLAMFKTVK